VAVSQHERGPVDTGDVVVADPGALLDALRARQGKLELSNATVEAIAGIAEGHLDKVIGPSRQKSPSLTMLFALMETLGLSVVLVPDPAWALKFGHLWKSRDRAKVRNTLLGKTTLKRAWPLILSELARRAGRARWAGMSKEERSVAMKQVRGAKLRKAS
jgi:hypothetical protein